VNPKMLVVAFIASFPSSRGGHNILVMMYLTKLVGEIRNLHTKHYLNMLVVQVVIKTSVFRNMVTLKIKDRVCREY
jgi:hypothetical protein